jgi:putative tricarboxylic transport membrane protein
MWTAVVLLVAGLAGVVQAWKLPLGTIETPGAGFFPFCLAVAFSIVVAALVVRAVRHPGPDGGGPLVRRDRQRRVVLLMAALFVYAFVLEALGFVLATFLLMVVLFRVVEPQRWIVAVGGATASSLLGHLVFRVWLGVRLPPGPWGF